MASRPGRRPVLEQAAKGDGDTASRAKEILADLDWNLSPDTPKRITNAIRQYRAAADGPAKEQLVRQLMSRWGVSVMPVLNRAMSHETDENVLNSIKEMMLANASHIAPELIWSGDLDKARALLEKAAMGDTSPKQMQQPGGNGEITVPDTVEDEDEPINTEAIRHYVAFLLLSAPAKLDAKIKELSAAKDKRSATFVALAYRAKGDLPSVL